ncbi:MAG: AAA family ATPase [Fretibacterium sp.]|nr:AAA family ATPase [Fretibacterium sp.]
MRFEFSVLRDFRSLREARPEWAPGLNLILGPNGSGKTNLLESLNILAGWGTFQGRTSGAVSWDSEKGRALLGARVNGEEEHELQVQISGRMTPRLDGKHATFTDLRLAVPSITFLPADINLVEGSPAVRRLFLDRLCALCSVPYARRLAEFRQISRHRTALLRQGRPVHGTTLPFARLGGWIMETRRRAVSLLMTLPQSGVPSGPHSGVPAGPQSGPSGLKLRGPAERVSQRPTEWASQRPAERVSQREPPPLKSPAAHEVGFPAAHTAGSLPAHTVGSLPAFSFTMTPELEGSGAESLLRGLEETAEKERYALRPLVGPNRDDLVLISMGRPAAESLSRGQKRRLVLSLILRAGRLIELQLRRKPVLFFDDLAAELDADARHESGAALLATGWQIFVTGTEDPFGGLDSSTLCLPL